MPNAQPNQYLLRNSEVELNYLTSGFQNQPYFTYNDGQQVRTFKGPEVRVVDTEMGKLVSVTIRTAVDTGSTSYSVLIPVINLADRATPERFHTLGVRTVHKTALMFPSMGPRQTYHVDCLEGTARSVEIPLGAPVGA